MYITVVSSTSPGLFLIFLHLPLLIPSIFNFFLLLILSPFTVPSKIVVNICFLTKICSIQFPFLIMIVPKCSTLECNGSKLWNDGCIKKIEWQKVPVKNIWETRIQKKRNRKLEQDCNNEVAKMILKSRMTIVEIVQCNGYTFMPNKKQVQLDYLFCYILNIFYLTITNCLPSQHI